MMAKPRIALVSRERMARILHLNRSCSPTRTAESDGISGDGFGRTTEPVGGEARPGGGLREGKPRCGPGRQWGLAGLSEDQNAARHCRFTASVRTAVLGRLLVRKARRIGKLRRALLFPVSRLTHVRWFGNGLVNGYP